jgi:hypothetical protein
MRIDLYDFVEVKNRGSMNEMEVGFGMVAKAVHALRARLEDKGAEGITMNWQCSDSGRSGIEIHATASLPLEDL